MKNEMPDTETLDILMPDTVESTDQKTEVLSSRCNFISMHQLFDMVATKGLSGEVKIMWNNLEERYREAVKTDQTFDEILKNSEAYLFYDDGRLVGAKVGSGKVNLDESLNTILKLGYGYHCGVGRDISIRIFECNVARENKVGYESNMNIHFKIAELQKNQRKSHSVNSNTGWRQTEK